MNGRLIIGIGRENEIFLIATKNWKLWGAMITNNLKKLSTIRKECD